jgi:predicted permease
LRHHLEAEARDRQSDGLSAADARRAALRDLGNIGLIQEAAREVWGWTSFHRLAQDIRYGLRMMRRSSGVTALAVVSLAAGIGANTTVYTIVRVVLSPPAGVPGASQVMNFHRRDSGGSRLLSVNYPDWTAFRDANSAFSSMCAWSEAPVALNAGDATEPAESLLITGQFFETFALRPAAGRFFSRAEETLPVAVVSHRFWRSHPESLGAAIRINGHPFTVIGVTPAGFTSPYAIFAPDLYVPLLRRQDVRPGPRFDHPGSEYLKMTGRLKPGIPRSQAEASLPALPPKPGERDLRRLTLSPLGDFPDDIRLSILGAAAFLFAIAGFVLAIACANVGSLLLARATARRHEIGVRLALGAGRARIVRQLVTESVLLFLPAAIGGLGLCFLAVSALAGFQAPMHLPIQFDLKVDYGVLLFTLALALAAGVLFGLAPAAQSLRAAVLPFLRETAISGQSRLRNAFLVCEFSLAFVLVMALGMFVGAAKRGGAVYPGNDPSRLYLVDLDLSTLGYPEGRLTAVYDRILQQTQSLPGVETAALAAAVPIGWEYMRSGMETADGSRSLHPDINRVTPGYFRTAGIALLRGRDFTSSDRGGATIPVIVNETMARTQWPGEDPLGKRLRQGEPPQILDVVGVAADTRQSLWAGPTPLFVYLPAAAAVPSFLILHIRPRGEPSRTLAAVCDIVRRVDENIPLQNASSLEERIRLLMLPHRIAATLAGAFGVLGTILAGLGIYGVTAYAVAQRTREIGLRVALGAEPARIRRTFSAEGTRLVGYALGISVALSFAIERLLQDLLFGMPPLDPLTVSAVAAAFTGVWLGGIYLPARRATAVDPSRALRWE